MYVPVPPSPRAVASTPTGISLAGQSLLAPIGAAARTVLTIRSADLNVLDGHPIAVTGALRLAAHTPTRSCALCLRLLEGSASSVRSAELYGRMVILQALGGHGWRTVARTRTRASGAFELRYLPRDVGSAALRARFSGNGELMGARRRLGRVNVHRSLEASFGKAMCVAEHESSLRWHIVDPPYSGGLQFSDSAWQTAGGGRFSSTAAGATPGQQVQVFSEYEPSHPGAWPVTVPACS